MASLEPCKNVVPSMCVLCQHHPSNRAQDGGTQPTAHNTGSLPLLLIEFKKQFPNIGAVNQLAITNFVLWAQQQQASA